jgi:hypothetical protein
MLWLAMALTMAVAAAAAEVGPDLRVVVRMYDKAGLDDEVLRAAVTTAVSILDATGLELTSYDCDVASAHTAAHPCSAPPGVNEIAVRIVRVAAEIAYRGELPLGYSLVDTGARSGTLATLYADRVSWLSQAAGVEMPLLLGRALAHEVGHLLLGTNRHNHSGLMRPLWSCDSLRRNQPRDWLFAPADATAMRQAVRLRATPMLARLGLAH